MSIYGGLESNIAAGMAKAASYGHNQKDLSFSNIGVSLRQHAGVEAMMFVPPVIPNALRVIGAVTAGGKLCLTLHTSDQMKFDKDKEIFERAVERQRSIGK